MAIKIGSKYDPYAVCSRHWQSLVPDTIRTKDERNKELLCMAIQCLDAAQTMKGEMISQGLRSQILDKICDVIEKEPI